MCYKGTLTNQTCLLIPSIQDKAAEEKEIDLGLKLRGRRNFNMAYKW
jgi:hypothetical protein